MEDILTFDSPYFQVKGPDKTNNKKFWLWINSSLLNLENSLFCAFFSLLFLRFNREMGQSFDFLILQLLLNHKNAKFMGEFDILKGQNSFENSRISLERFGSLTLKQN